MKNPFAPSTSRPGHGSIILSLLPPSTPVLQTLSYQYPLKLIAPEPITLQRADPAGAADTVHTVFLLTYGGGLVAGDTITLRVALAASTRLILLTQGSTKVFKAPSAAPRHRAGQTADVRVAPGAALCYLPDPVQPFRESGFAQTQRYVLSQDVAAEPGSRAQQLGSLCVLDWVCEGRSALGESWDFHTYVSRNEVWLAPPSSSAFFDDDDGDQSKGRGRLLLRDNVILHNEGAEDGDSVTTTGTIVGRMDGIAAFGTLIIHGPVFSALAQFFLNEFAAMPRIGAKKWHTVPAAEQQPPAPEESARVARIQQESDDGVLWSAASVRGSVLVKFGAKSAEGARRWLGYMIRGEGTIEREFGERALLCLR